MKVEHKGYIASLGTDKKHIFVYKKGQDKHEMMTPLKKGTVDSLELYETLKETIEINIMLKDKEK